MDAYLVIVEHMRANLDRYLASIAGRRDGLLLRVHSIALHAGTVITTTQ